MSAKLKWELHILGDDLVSETVTLIEIIKQLRAHDLPAPHDFTTDHLDTPSALVAALPVPQVSPPPPPDPPKRTRKVRTAPVSDPATEVLLDDLVAEEPAPTEKVNGAVTGEFAHLTGAEARDKGLVLLRLSYAAPDGGADAVKALQKSLKIAKFTDVPDDEGHALLDAAIKIATQFGLVSP